MGSLPDSQGKQVMPALQAGIQIQYNEAVKLPAETKMNKHAQRTRITREQLLRSAETIFVRDGYEGAELGEIAEAAGRTKGAIYAHFKNKEEIFMALFLERREHYRNQMRELLGRAENRTDNLAAMRQITLNMANDSTWALLLLEFKLYAMRHPESLERFQNCYEEVFQDENTARVNDLLGAVEETDQAVSRLTGVRLYQPIISALAVESGFSPNKVGPELVTKVAGMIFDILFPAEPPAKSKEN